MNDTERDIEAPTLPAGVGADPAVGEALKLESHDGGLSQALRGGLRDAAHSRLMHQVAPCVGLIVSATGLRHKANALPHLRGACRRSTPAIVASPPSGRISVA